MVQMERSSSRALQGLCFGPEPVRLLLQLLSLVASLGQDNNSQLFGHALLSTTTSTKLVVDPALHAWAVFSVKVKAAMDGPDRSPRR